MSDRRAPDLARTDWRRPEQVTAARTDGLVAYQYVVLRCVPRVDREEFLNVGVVLLAEDADLLVAAYRVNEARLLAVAPDLDLTGLRERLAVVSAVCEGAPVAGLPADARLRRRFGWLAAPRSTVLQPGPVHGGLTDDPQRELEVLVARIVG